MLNLTVELSKYVILTLMVVYTFYCFYLVRRQSREDQTESLNKQILLIFLMDTTAIAVIYLKKRDSSILIFYGLMMLYFSLLLILFRALYKKASMLLLNNMCMLQSVGFVMLCRLNIESANRQLLISAGGGVLALLIPFLIRAAGGGDVKFIFAGGLLVGFPAVFPRNSHGSAVPYPRSPHTRFPCDGIPGRSTAAGPGKAYSFRSALSPCPGASAPRRPAPPGQESARGSSR